MCMKRLKLIGLSIFLAGAFSPKLFAQQDSTGLPGDNFNLKGALDLFRQSSSPEDFEKKINSPDNHVNNLDLDGDGQVDYVKVIDRSSKNDHAFALQVAVSADENQDIAVIELEKTGDTTAQLQLVGDKDIFGEELIAEPSTQGDEQADNGSPVPGHGPFVARYQPERIIFNVFFWPCVQFVYRPLYVPWVSPWRWMYYPVWWKPWRPLGWHVFHPYCIRYYPGYAFVRTHRMGNAYAVYKPYRCSSVIVRTRTVVVHNRYRTAPPYIRPNRYNRPRENREFRRENRPGREMHMGGGRRGGNGRRWRDKD